MKRGRNIYRTPRARRDVIEVATHIGIHNESAAMRFLDAVESELQLLLEMPGLGTLRSFRYRGLVGVRSVPMTGFRNYLIFYRPTRRGVTFIRLLHGARNLQRAWRGR